MKEKMETGTDLFRTEKIPKILLKIAPPVMLAQLIRPCTTSWTAFSSVSIPQIR